MIKRDIQHPTLAKRFAWRMSAQLEDEVLEDKAEDAEDPAAQEKLEASRRQAIEEAGELAVSIQHAWSLARGRAQLAATKKIAARAADMNFRLFALRRWPLESVQLALLLIRYADSFGEEERKHASWALHLLDLSHPQGVEVYVGLAEAGCLWLLGAVELALQSSEGDLFPSDDEVLASRLVAVLNGSASWDARYAAARLLAHSNTPQAIAALRDALLGPSVRIRVVALEALLDAEMLTEEELGALLDDAVIHPPPDDPFEPGYYYAEELTRALQLATPPDGLAALECIADGEAVYTNYTRGALDEGWALDGLAAGYPAHALPRIDAELQSMRSWSRVAAIEAARRLPEVEARPRLLRGLVDPSWHVLEAARKAWDERGFGSRPGAETDGADLTLLDAPPSEAFLGRLAIMRGESENAKRAMSRVLLRGEPDRETLVLLLVAIQDDRVRVQRSEGLPSGEDEWGEMIVSRFGDLGALGLSNQWARFPGDSRWPYLLERAAERGVLGERTLTALRQRTADLIGQPWSDSRELHYVLSLMERIGAVPGQEGRLLSLAVEYDIYGAFRVLAKLPDTEALRCGAIEAARHALRARDLPKLERVLQAIGQRGWPEILEVAAACVESVDAPDDANLRECLKACVGVLRRAGRIDDAWILQALERPESPLFAAALEQELPEECAETARALRTRALDSDVRDGRAAADALCALVDEQATRRRETFAKRLEKKKGGRLPELRFANRGLSQAAIRVLDRCSPRDRVEVLHRIGVFLSFSVVERYLLDLLVTEDDFVRMIALECIDDAPRSRSLTRLLKKALAVEERLAPEIADSVREHLGMPTAAEQYWEDRGDF
jgi:hypothetical protein